MNIANMTKFFIDTDSPYYPSKGLGMLIPAVIFNPKNYDLWEIAVRMTLKTKNKLGFINGTQTRPTIAAGQDPSELQAWQMVNMMISSWILNVVDPKL